MIGANSYSTTAQHEFRNPARTIREKGLYGEPVKIEDDVWVAAHVMILPGVTVGHGAIVGGGAVVTHDVPPGEIWAWIPAKKISERRIDR